MDASLDRYPARPNAAPTPPYPLEELTQFAGSLPRERLVEVGSILPLAEAHAVLTDDEIVGRFEQDGAVKTPPRFAEQAQDQSRQETFSYSSPFQPSSKINASLKPGGATTEIAGLEEAQGVLREFLERDEPPTPNKEQAEKTATLKARTSDMLENLTFIGEHEYQEAVRGLGVLWKNYLDADPRNKLFVLTEVGKLGRFEGVPKSDEYVRDGVIATWTPEERARYAGRLLGELPDSEEVDPRFAKVIMVDDWSISGRQMRDNYGRLMRNPAFERLAGSGNVEINVLAASENRISKGLALDPEDPESATIPVKAYYRSHFAETSPGADHSFVTGFHSYVNYGFGNLFREIAKRSEGNRRTVPMLARVYPSYKVRPPRFAITDGEIKELRSAETAAKAGRVVTALKRGSFMAMPEMMAV